MSTTLMPTSMPLSLPTPVVLSSTSAKGMGMYEEYQKLLPTINRIIVGTKLKMGDTASWRSCGPPTTELQEVQCLLARLGHPIPQSNTTFAKLSLVEQKSSDSASIHHLFSTPLAQPDVTGGEKMVADNITHAMENDSDVVNSDKRTEYSYGIDSGDTMNLFSLMKCCQDGESPLYSTQGSPSSSKEKMIGIEEDEDLDRTVVGVTSKSKIGVEEDEDLDETVIGASTPKVCVEEEGNLDETVVGVTSTSEESPAEKSGVQEACRETPRCGQHMFVESENNSSEDEQESQGLLDETNNKTRMINEPMEITFGDMDDELAWNGFHEIQSEAEARAEHECSDLEYTITPAAATPPKDYTPTKEDGNTHPNLHERVSLVPNLSSGSGLNNVDSLSECHTKHSSYLHNVDSLSERLTQTHLEDDIKKDDVSDAEKSSVDYDMAFVAPLRLENLSQPLMKPCVTLHPHQTHALAWMLGREDLDVTSLLPFRGGILADEMGLGKTVTCLALITSDAEKHRQEAAAPIATTRQNRPSLIVVPAGTLSQWVNEFRSKTSLTLYVHHGKTRLRLGPQPKGREGLGCTPSSFRKHISMHDVTITTYTTLSASEVSAEEHVNTLQHWDDETQLGGSQWREKKKPKSPVAATEEEGEGKEKEKVNKKGKRKAKRKKKGKAKTKGNKGGKNPQLSLLHIVGWYRVMLDEAHLVGNPRTKRALAVQKVFAHCRWCVTGTPMQNAKTDLIGLQRFLMAQVNRNCHQTCSPTKEAVENEGQTQENMMNCLIMHAMLRRTKESIDNLTGGDATTAPSTATTVRSQPGNTSTVSVSATTPTAAAAASSPHRSEAARKSVKKKFHKNNRNNEKELRGLISPITYTTRVLKLRKRTDERRFYSILSEAAKSRVFALLGKDSSRKSRSPHFMHIFEQLLRLRQACNHPALVLDGIKRKIIRCALKDVQALYDQGGKNDKGENIRQGGNIRRKGQGLGETKGHSSKKQRRDREEKALWRELVPTAADDFEYLNNEAKGRLPFEKDGADENFTGSESVESLVRLYRKLRMAQYDDESDTVADIRSTKVRAMIQEMHTVCKKDNSVKFLVISQWPKFLQLVSSELKIAQPPRQIDGESDFEDGDSIFNCHSDCVGIPHTILHGSMSLSDREAALKVFQESSAQTQRCLLLSLTCGGTGLNITAASHVFIMEPSWNPSLETQAIARAHRLGQERPVRVTRLVIDKSVEKRMKELQEKKKTEIANVLQANEASAGIESDAQLCQGLNLSTEQMLQLFQ